MLITRGNGHTDSTWQDEFPVSELQPGTRCRVVHTTGGVWPIEIEEAHTTWIKTKGGARFDLEEVAEIKLKW
jgi:hypothetical protein